MSSAVQKCILKTFFPPCEARKSDHLYCIFKSKNVLLGGKLPLFSIKKWTGDVRGRRGREGLTEALPHDLATREDGEVLPERADHEQPLEGREGLLQPGGHRRGNLGGAAR